MPRNIFEIKTTSKSLWECEDEVGNGTEIPGIIIDTVGYNGLFLFLYISNSSSATAGHAYIKVQEWTDEYNTPVSFGDSKWVDADIKSYVQEDQGAIYYNTPLVQTTSAAYIGGRRYISPFIVGADDMVGTLHLRLHALLTHGIRG